MITPGFQLKAKYVIHAVGPVWYGGLNNEPEDLYNAYRNSLKRAVEAGCRSIAFPLISAGIFGYPLQGAWEQALRACLDFREKHPDTAPDVVFAVLDDGIIAAGRQTLAAMEGR